MNKRKLRFNALDALLILILAAVIGVVLYVFVLNKDDGQSAQSNSKPIEYTIYVKELEEYCSDLVKAGQPVTDAIRKQSIGTVVGVEESPMMETTFNYEDGVEVDARVEGMICLKITVAANATDTGRAFIVDGCTIRVGEQYSIMLPELYCTGYCIDINDNIQ